MIKIGDKLKCINNKDFQLSINNNYEIVDFFINGFIISDDNYNAIYFSIREIDENYSKNYYKTFFELVQE